MSIIEDLTKARKERLARMEPRPPAPSETVEKFLAGPMTMRRIQRMVAKHFDVPLEGMLSKSRNAIVNTPRMVAVFLVKEFTNRSLPEIGRSFNRDHTTILHAVRTIGEKIRADEVLRTEVDALRKKIGAGEQEDTTLREAVEESVRNFWLSVRELEGYRRHLGARKFLKAQACMDDLEMGRDLASRIFDDLRGET